MSAHDLSEILKKVRYDLTAAQGKLSEAMRAIAGLNLPEPAELVCIHCGLVCGGPKVLAEHLYYSHQGPVPPHWIEAERLAGE